MDLGGTMFGRSRAGTPNRRHHENDGGKRNDSMKTCNFYKDKGRCRFGDHCRYSHDLSKSTNAAAKGPPRQDDSSIRQGEDKLRMWKRLLNRTQPNRGGRVDVGRFFELALELMDGDLGASQETVRMLATDAGLDFIKEVTGPGILEAQAADLRTKVNLWQSQIRPLLRLVTHPRAIDSNVLEQEVAIIHAFILGPNARRADNLFGFIIDLAQAWPENTHGHDTLMTVLELSLAVLFRLVDCSTTTIINETFQSFVERFGLLLAASSEPDDSFSKLQATRYLDYLHRRLGVGKNMAVFTTRVAAAVRPEEFVLLQDLPGHLSRDGPRHDNDHADISKIRIMPTYEEITSARNEYLPTTDSSQWHLPGIRGRLDREFRLLREDTVGQLRDAVSDMLQHLRNPAHQGHRQSQNSARTTTYDEAMIHQLRLDKDRGLEVTLRCRQPDMARKMTKKQRKTWWEECKRLQPGALACVLDVAGMILFLVVADSTLRSEESGRKNDSAGQTEAESNTGGAEKLTLSSDEQFLFVKMHLVGNSRADISRVLKWFKEIGSHPSRRLVEFPGVLLPSFQYTLEALQDLSRKPELPFTDLIAPEAQSPAGEAAVSPPLFARAPGFSFDLRCLTKDGEAFSVGLDTIPTAETVSSRTGLDLTQSDALLNTFCRELSLIQGPPGTGKSYTGEKILKVLLHNKKKANLGPIVCVCYTNHALDQLLEHLLDDGIKGIIRMGSRSKSERLENLNIRVVSDKMSQTRTEKYKYGDIVRRMRDLESDATKLLDQLRRFGSLSSVRSYLSESHRPHYNELFPTEEEGWETVGNKKHDVIQQWLAGGSGPGFGVGSTPRSADELKHSPLAAMTHQERSILYRSWLHEIRRFLITELIDTLQGHNEAREERSRLRQEVRRRCLQEADIVGVTTTGLARELHLLRKLRTKVMLCEEAGEVLEAHILTAMLPSVEQAVLIGDHQQLRPQIQNYQLQSTNPSGAQYSLDMSLFERLVQPPHARDPRLPVSVLETQRRMHPSIAEMVRSTLYKQLKDASNVMEYPEVVGMRRRLFWLHHEALEAGATSEDPHNTSHSNDYEVQMTASLVSHLVRQGKYSPQDIAVLTPYLGQLQKLRLRMAQESTFAVTLDDRDLDELDELENAQPQKQPVPRHQSVTKTTLARSIRLATVDNFQGEESKVVIITLVRSNPQNRCGFLSTSNRINVLLSRAKHGCYIIGNSHTYSHVPMWKQVIHLLKADSNFGNSLELQCPRHPATPILVSQPEHFVQFSPDAGCTLRCDRRLDCGHACHGRCHSDLVHKAVKCIEDCPRPKKGCEHPCPLRCGDQCEDKCRVTLENIHLKLPCGHIMKTAKCWQTQDPASVKCLMAVDKKVPGCGHVVVVPCHMDVNNASYQCRAECGHVLPCGHTCHSTCFTCNEREDGKVVKTNHGFCHQVCGRNFTACPHTCPQSCHGDTKCGPCLRPCEARCSHSRCSRPCYEPCVPCAEQRCASHCPHGECTMPCAAPCDWIPCSRRCTLVLSCGHQCPSICGEGCPDARYCQTCGPEDILTTIVDLLEMKEYKDVTIDETPCIFPDCGHFFTVETMDGQMSMHEHYELDENGSPVGMASASKPFSMDEVKACSVCRASLRSVSRYGRIVRRAMLDEATKKFISWSAHRHVELAQALVNEQQKLEESTDQVKDVGRAGQLALTGPPSMQIRNLRKWVGKKRYNGLAQIYASIEVFAHQVSVEEQPFHRVFELVRHARRNKALGGTFNYDEDIIQLRGYLLALSLLVKCSITFLSDFTGLWKASGILRTEISVDLAANLELCDTLTRLAADTSRPQLQAEGHIYSAQLCGFAIALDRSGAGPAGEHPDAPVPGVLPQDEAAASSSHDAQDTAAARREQLRDRGLDHLARARNLLGAAGGGGSGGGSRQVMEAEMEAAEGVLRGGVSYRPVTASEMRAVYDAMAAEFHGTGHWYTCERGHPFTVGECGMPMQQARCPECGSPVGGQNHSPAEGVRRADAIEELGRGMGGLRI